MFRVGQFTSFSLNKWFLTHSRQLRGLSYAKVFPILHYNSVS